METYPRSEQSEPFPQNRKVQNGDTGKYKDIPPTRRVGHFDRLQGRLLSHPHTGTISEISEISRGRENLSVQSPPLWPVHSSYGIHCSSKGGETHGHTQGYKNPPVPRRLVSEGKILSTLSPAYSDTGRNVPGTRLAGDYGKVGIGPKANVQFCRLPIRPRVRSGPTHTGTMAESPRENSEAVIQTDLPGPGFHVHDRIINSHREAGSPRPLTHEAYSMASEEQLEGPGIIRKVDSITQVSASPFALVAGGRQCSHRSNPTPRKACSASLYRRIKRRLGRSLKRAHCKRRLVPPGKQTTHQLPGIESSFSSPKGFSKSLYGKDGSYSNRQHHCSVLHKQRRRHEVGPPMCPPLENSDLVLNQLSHAESKTHSRQIECSGRQVIQTRSNHSNRMVPSSRNFRSSMQPVAPASSKPFRHEVQQQATSFCVTSTGPLGYGSRRPQLAMGGSGRIRFPTDSHLGQISGEATGLPLQEIDPHCTGMAQHDLVLGLGRNVQPDPIVSASSTQLADSALQSNSPQESDQSKPPCMAPRATAIKEQGFSEAVAARIEAPQRSSTRSVYEAKWTIFTKWCISNQVDFQSPPVKSVADFLLYLFEDKKLQPSTIDGYRSAIADKLGSSKLNIGKDENLTRLLDSFHRDRPKGRRGIPSWNLSLVLHQLTKAPFEPLGESSLKHLTLKTVFLLALASGKRRSEIHAWQHRNSLTGQKSPCIHHPAFCQRISWQKRVQWLYQHWPQPWRSPSSLTGLFVQLEPCATI